MTEENACTLAMYDKSQETYKYESFNASFKPSRETKLKDQRQ